MAPLPAKYKFKAQGAEAKPKATAKKKSAKTEAPSEADWCQRITGWVSPRKRKRRARKSNGPEAASRSEGQGHRPA